MQCINVMPLPLLHGGGPQHTRELEGKAVFPAGTLCQPISARVPLPSSPGAEASLPSVPGPCLVMGGMPVQPLRALHRARAFVFPTACEQKCLSSAPSELPRLLFVLPFKQLLMACGTARSWQGSSSLPQDAALGISSLSAGSQHPREDLPLCLWSENQYAAAWSPSLHLLCQGLACQCRPGSSSSVVPQGRDWGSHASSSNNSGGQAKCEQWET